MEGKKIVELIFDWADKNNVHPDDFGMLFADELIEKMESDT